MALAFVALTCVGSSTARADVITFTSFGGLRSAANAAGIGPFEHILAQGTATGTTVTGITNQSNLLMNVSSSQPLTISDIGTQARIAGAGGATFDEFTIRFQSDAAFQALAFNLNETSTCTELNPCTLQFNLTGSSLLAGEETQTIAYTGGSGFIGFLALGDQRITSVTLAGGITLESISQVRVGGINVAPGPVAAVPEPMTMLLFGTGLAGIAAGLRRRRKA